MNTKPVDREDIFHRAAEMSDVQQRMAYLQSACQGDAALVAEIEDLLQHDAVARSFLEGGALEHDGVEETIFSTLEHRPGQMIGPFKLREQIGEGGFGLVFVAEQVEPVRRKVALKVIKPGMDSKNVLARFKAEQQALALMDHPNIAQVFDAGTTDSGRPYFVMELVRGIPLVEYCNQERLSVRERVELMISVCQAVQHAHAKGVIHRDLKPSNVMVAPHDGVPVVKVIDFGVAKAIGQQLTDQTVYTAYSQMIGTPLYMSPEQAEINAIDIDIRSDVYSLGVLLYELLTGVTPFDRSRFKSAAFDEIRRIIKEEDPPKPSTRVTTLGKLHDTVSDKRRTDPVKLSSMIAGDLDWIVMKALEKERSRRYQTAGELIDELRNYLHDEPVDARPPMLTYRAKKFIRRNRAAVSIAATLFVAMTVTIVGTSAGMFQANLAAEEARELADDKQQALDERDRANGELVSTNEALASNLWLSKLREAQALIDRRAPGYKAKVFAILRDLVNSCEQESDLIRVKDLAVTCLGDASALNPIWELDDSQSEVLSIDLTTDGRWLAIRFANQEVSLVEVESGRKNVVCEAGSGVMGCGFINTDLFRVDRIESTQIWERNGRGDWIESEKGDQAQQRFTGRVNHIDGIRNSNGTTLAVARRNSILVIKRSESLIRSDREVLTHPDVVTGGRFGFERVSLRNDGALIAALIRDLDAHRQQQVAVWDANTGTLLGTRLGEDASFSSDGRWLTVACGDRGIEVFDADDLDDFTDARPINYRRGDSVYSARALPDGRTVVYAGRQSGLIRIWDVSANQEVATLGHGYLASQVECSADGSVVASMSRNQVKLWRMTDLPERLQLAGHHPGAKAMDYSPQGDMLATTGADGKVRLWDTTTGELLRELPGGGQAVEFSSDGQWLAAGSDQTSEVSVWRVDDETETRFTFDADVGAFVWCVHFCNADEQLAISGTSGVRLLDFTRDPLRPVQEFSAADETRVSWEETQRIDSDATRLFWMSKLDWWSPKTAYSLAFSANGEPARLERQTFSDNRSGYSIRPEGGFMLTDLETDQLHQFDDRGQPVGKPLANHVAHLALHPSRPWVAVSSRYNIEVWDRVQGRRLWTLPDRDRVIWFLDWHPTSNQLAVAFANGIVEVWNIDAVEHELAQLGLDSTWTDDGAELRDSR